VRGILILSLLPIAVAAAHAEDLTTPTPIPRPAIAAATVPRPISPAVPAATSAPVAVPPDTTQTTTAVPASSNVSVPPTRGPQAGDVAAPVSAPGLAAAPEPGHHKRLTMEEHFAQANAAHDGHLTLDEAKAGYRSLVRHFPDIDAKHKGYVTIEDLRAWRAQQRAARNGTHSADGALHPRPAYEPGMTTDRRSFNTSAAQTIAKTPDTSTSGATTPAAQ
jgi:hypothetical protein